MAERAANARREFDAGLADDLNTAQALAAIFDLVREANIAMDRGEFRQGDVAVRCWTCWKCSTPFSPCCAMMTPPNSRTLGISSASPALSDAEIEALIAERQAARKRRDFAASDRIRDQLAERGIILEDSRDGAVRWKRK